MTTPTPESVVPLLDEDKVAALSLQQKKELLKLLVHRQEVRSADPLGYYKPYPKQEEFHKDPSRIRLFIGSNRSGKSTAGVVEDLWYATGTHPHRPVATPTKGWICGPDFPTWARTVMIPKLKALIPKAAVAKISKNHEGVETSWELTNGTTLEIKAYTQDPMSFESADIDWAHFDEPPPKGVFDAATRGLVDRNGPIWLTMTPISEPWVYRDLWCKAKLKEPGFAAFQATIYDNPYLSPEGILAFEKTVSKDYAGARLLGQFRQLQGRVFKPFDREVHVLDGFWPQPGWPIYRGMDPHVYGRKNQAVLWMTITPSGDFVFFDEIWADLTIEKLRDRVIEHDHDPAKPPVNLQGSVVDTSINVREAITHRNFRDLLCAPGKWGRKLHFSPANKKDLVLPGLEYINSLLELRPDPRTQVKRPRMFVASRCRRFIEELELHTWHDPRDVEKQGMTEQETPTYNDMVSIARYIFNQDPAGVRRRGNLRFSNNTYAYSHPSGGVGAGGPGA